MLFISFMLLASISGIVPNQVQNEVHEWGIVIFEQGDDLMCGETWQNSKYYPDHDYLEMCAEAPVVWIHGEPFDDATFIVKTGEQTITFTYPLPNRTELGISEWDVSAHNISVTDISEETEMLIEEEFIESYQGPFWWAVDSWREVSSLQLSQIDYGITENFLYYECTVDRSFTDNFFNWGDNGNPNFAGMNIQDAILFTPEGAFSIRLSELVPNLLSLPISSKIDTERILNTFSIWGESNLDHLEIVALWETWKPVFNEEDSYWLVFPIPEEFNNSISTIELQTPDQRLVVYNRLFLGAVRLNL